MLSLFVNNLTVIDFSYFDPERGILGDSLIVDIALEGNLDEQGMVFDFGHVKKTIKQIIDSELDHRFVISRWQPGLTIKHSGKSLNLNWPLGLHTYQHCSPDEAVVLLDTHTISPKTLTTYLKQKICTALPENVSTMHISLRAEQIEGACYQYSHGLKKHQGNCQRIVHGHRSKIEIFENGARAIALENQWANQLQDCYIGTQEDLKTISTINDETHVTFNYRAEQGQFELTLPKTQVYLIDTDSTVEWIATHIAEGCKQKKPNNKYDVFAYEGVGKGAIARS